MMFEYHFVSPSVANRINICYRPAAAMSRPGGWLILAAVIHSSETPT
jgi:hypothetical protein